MALFSRLFKGNEKLICCQLKDADHITPGSVGFHVRLIQTALVNLGFGRIHGREFIDGRYGSTTADAVLRYKTSRQIINFSYQQKPDNIVGKMTISRLDHDLLASQDKSPYTL
jgi:peptidoglycan hydrolase-like protein with peptidoglycan-binding domain